MSTIPNIKELIIRILKNNSECFEKAKKAGYPLERVTTQESSSYPMQTHTTYDFKDGKSGGYCNCDWRGTAPNIGIGASTFHRLSYYFTENDINELLALFEPAPIPKPRILGKIEAGLVFNLSKCYDVLVLQQQGKLKLFLDLPVDPMPTHTYVRDNTRPFIADFYIKYESQKSGDDLRDSVLPPVDELHYCCDETADYVNLPGSATKDVQVINSGCLPIILTTKAYAKYVKIHPKFLHQHKYVKLLRNEFVIDYFKYCIDHFNCTGGSKYYFSITNNEEIVIRYGKPNEEYCVLTHDAIEHFKGIIKVAKYCPASVTNLIGELDEIKQLIASLDVKLSVAFDY